MAKWIASRNQIRELDQRAIQEFNIPASDLMERAGTAAFEVLKRMAPPGSTVFVACGKGNNGGDGLVVARLAHQQGSIVHAWLSAPEAEFSADAAHQLELARRAGVATDHESEVPKCDVIVDALLGTGFSGTVSEPLSSAISALQAIGAPILSLDVPSGVDCDTGRVTGTAIRATRTITYGLPKPFLFQNDGLEHSGEWTVADLGYPESLLMTPRDSFVLENVDLHIPIRARSSHKGSNGSVLIVAGSDNMPGAAVLATLGAIRSGAGLVTIASTESVCRTVSCHVPEALTMPLPEAQGFVSPDAVATILDAPRTFDAAVFGPGLGQDKQVVEFLRSIWAIWTIPTVLDADALNVLALGVEPPKGAKILTPHPGEMGRLLDKDSAEIQNDRFRAVRAASERWNATVVLKCAYSLIASPGVSIAVNPTGNPGMATGGMGDVLSGIMATLLAQRNEPNQAATTAVYWHGLAADLASRDVGSVGYTASDVAKLLPEAREALIPAT